MDIIKDYKTTKELLALGVSEREIRKQYEEGILVKIKQGLYRPAAMFLQNQSFIDVSMAVPKGIICMFSALAYYELTTFIPKQVDIAVPIISVRSRIIYPPVKRYYIATDIFNKYVKTVANEKYSFKIYDIEKTVCDGVRYRNNVGVDIAKEAV
jgi:predicted transcriptional regulator of viral defense system